MRDVDTLRNTSNKDVHGAVRGSETLKPYVDIGLDPAEACYNDIPLYGGCFGSFRQFDMYNHEETRMLLEYVGPDVLFINRMLNIWTDRIIVDKLDRHMGTHIPLLPGKAKCCTCSLVVVKLTASIWCRVLDCRCPTLSKAYV